jgi:Mrp family chromosome partitioning ATPase
MVMSSSSPRPSTQTSDALPLWRSVGERWRGGAMIALITAFALPLWWRIEDSAFEVVALLEQAPNASPEQEQAERRRLGQLADEAARERRKEPGIGPEPEPAAALEERDDGALALTCRGQSPQAAEALCDQLLRKGLAPGGALRLLTDDPRASRATTLLRLPVMLVGATTGILAGLLWMLSGALFARRRATPRRSLAPAASMPYADEELSLDRLPERWSFALPGLPTAGRSGATRGDAMQLLCDEAERLARQGATLIGFTSAPADRVRKAYAAAQFASLLAARRRLRVLLVEGDFEEPAVDRVMQVAMPSMSGFSQQLQWRDPANTSPWTVVQVGSHLSVLAEGRVRVLGQLHSEHFRNAMAQLSRQHDILVMDGPPFGDAAAIQGLERIASGLVFVTTGRTNVAEVQTEVARMFSEKALSSVLIADPVGS